MEIKVIHELGPLTLALLTGAINSANSGETGGKATTTAAPAKAEAAAPKATGTPKKTATAEKGFADLDEAGKLEYLKGKNSEVAKKLGLDNIKTLLKKYDAGKTGDLAAGNYDAYHADLLRLIAGEKAEAIAGGAAGSDDEI